MSEKNTLKGRMPLIALLMIVIFTNLSILTFAGTPTNPTVVYNTSETVTPRPALLLNTTGGSFTTLIFNATSQNYKWKAYVGNVTGRLTLADQSNKSIYDWRFTSITGKVYASRNNSVDWSTISCADRSNISTEDSYLNIQQTSIDSINNTFNRSIHKGFYAANRQIQNSTCPSIATFVNDTTQTINESAKFQEVILKDAASRLIFTTIIEGGIKGFDDNPYDFQMIVPNDETIAQPTPYYFFIELG